MFRTNYAKWMMFLIQFFFLLKCVNILGYSPLDSVYFQQISFKQKSSNKFSVYDVEFLPNINVTKLQALSILYPSRRE